MKVKFYKLYNITVSITKHDKTTVLPLLAFISHLCLVAAMKNISSRMHNTWVANTQGGKEEV